MPLKAARLSLEMLPGQELTSTRFHHARLSGDVLDSSCWQPGNPRAQARHSPAAREAGAGREIRPTAPVAPRDCLGVCFLVFRAGLPHEGAGSRGLHP